MASSDSSIKRAREIINLGFREMDSLHISLAEEVKADYFVTCDDGIVRKAKKHQERLKVKICSILECLEEVVHHVESNK